MPSHNPALAPPFPLQSHTCLSHTSSHMTNSSPSAIPSSLNPPQSPSPATASWLTDCWRIRIWVRSNGTSTLAITVRTSNLCRERNTPQCCKCSNTPFQKAAYTYLPPTKKPAPKQTRPTNQSSIRNTTTAKAAKSISKWWSHHKPTPTKSAPPPPSQTSSSSASIRLQPQQVPTTTSQPGSATLRSRTGIL